MTWVLIIIVVFGQIGGTSIDHIEFNSEAACVQAAKFAYSRAPLTGTQRMDAYCVPKS